MHRRQAARTAQQPLPANNERLEEANFSAAAAAATSHHNVRQNSANAQIGDILNVASNHHHHHHRQHPVDTGASKGGIGAAIQQAQAKLQEPPQQQYTIFPIQHLNDKEEDSNYSNLKPANSFSHQFEASEASSSRKATLASSHLKHSSSLTTGPKSWQPSASNKPASQQKLSNPLNDQDEAIGGVRMTRTPHNAGSVSAMNPAYVQASANPDINPNASAAAAANATPGNYLDYSYNNNMICPSQQQQQQQPVGSSAAADNSSNPSAAGQPPLSKVHAHSTSLLANDSYMAGMSSDSDSLGRQHGRSRPYSSQSRVYHAHPAPRSSNPSSRLSHYSDSAASYNVQSTANEPVLSGHSSINLPSQQQATHPTHQGFVSSSGSTSSTPYLAGYPDLPAMQQRAAGMPVRPTSGHQQLPHHPARQFKQSMSIDHHSAGQYHHQSSASHHHLTSPAHSISHYEPSPHSLETLHNAYQGQQQQQQSLAGYSAGTVSLTTDGRRIGNMASGSQTMSPYNHDQVFAGQQQRNFRLEMEMMEKQTSNINLYDNESNRPFVHTSAGLPPRSSSRQLPPTNSSGISLLGSASMSVDHLHHRADNFNPPQVHPSELQQQKFPNHPQQPQQQQQQQQEDLYTTHHLASPATDWLPTMSTPSHHHLSRPGTQFKQAMSIDHYPISGQQHHYSPVRASHLNEHYRSSLGYATSSPVGGYESPGRSTQSAGSDHHNEMLYHHYLQEQEQQQLPSYVAVGSSHQHQARQNPDLHDSNQHQPPSSVQASNFSHSANRGISPSGKPKKRSELQHQFSSSSSNSGQSGSLHNVDISKSLIDQQKANTIARLPHQQSPKHKSGTSHEQQRQQQKQAPLRKGYTSVVSSSGVAGGGGAYSESGNPSLGQITATSIGGETHLSLQGGKRTALRATSPSGTLEAATSSASGQHHHSSSSKEGGAGGSRSESSTGTPNGANAAPSSLTKKSNSATQLSMTGTKKRLGFRKKQLTSFSVHRSEEVAPLTARHLVKQGSSVSEGDSSMSGDSSSRSWSNSNFKPQTSDELASMSFIDGLGKGQMISRQGLASPYLGDIQLSLCDRRGYLEVEIIRARNLQAKANKDTMPLTYVKLYLVKNRKCLAKAKTNLSNKRTLDPFFQQLLTFHEDYHGCILQSIIWGNFGKMDKKNFMGIAQISLDDLELGDTVISWYKLFLPSSLQTLPSKCLRHTLLSNSTESFTNTNNS